jgi:hypothetical protein
MMVANRQAAGITTAQDPKPRKQNARKGPTKAERARENAPGTKAMRAFIIAEKPSKKIVKDHFEAIIAAECETSSDED